MKRPDVWLLDVNLLIALVHEAHVHHELAHRWFDSVPQRQWATCALTQLAFLRLTTNPKVVDADFGPSAALDVLTAMTAQPEHAYWDDGPEPVTSKELASPAVSGHRQITDAYLLTLAVRRRQRLATLDRGLNGFARALGLSSHLEWISSQTSRTAEG